MANPRRFKLSVDPLKISGVHVDMPVLATRANFPDEFFDPAYANRSAGDDLRAFNEDGTTEIARELVGTFALDSADGAGDGSIEAHILWPLLDAADPDPYLWLEYGDRTLQDYAAADPFGRDAVWPAYDLVVHCNSATFLVDSTGNSTVTPSGTITEVTGPFGTGLNFAAGAYLNVTGNPALIDRPTNYPFGVSLWAKKPIWGEATSGGYADAFGWGGTDDLLFLPYEISGTTERTRVFWRDTFAARPVTNNANLTNPMTIGTWNRFAVGIANNDQRLYINDELGTDDGTNTGALTGVGPFNSFRIGGWADASQDFRGDISEFRVGPDREADWVATEYNNQSSPATFATAGTPEDVDGGVFAVNDLYSVNYISRAVLTSGGVMSVNDLFSGNFVGSSALTADHTLAVDGLYSGNYISQASLSSGGVMSVNDLFSDNFVNSVPLTADHTLAVNGLYSGNYISQAALSSGGVMSVNDLFSDNFISAISLTADHTLAVNGLYSGNYISQAVLSAGDIFDVNDLYSTSYISEVSWSADHLLSVAGLYSENYISRVALTLAQAAIAWPDESALLVGDEARHLYVARESRHLFA